MYNNVDRNITGKVITRRGNQRGNYDVEHQANEITLSTGEKFILDLTLDLYLKRNTKLKNLVFLVHQIQTTI